jgi:hypothetical protein
MGIALSVHAQTVTGAGGGAVTGGTTTTVQGNGGANKQPNQQQQGNGQPNTMSRGVVNPPNRPYQTFTNPISPVNTNGPQYGQTNQYTKLQTNSTAFGRTPTNYNMSGTNSATYNASITNTLATMSPAQAQSVIQVQAGLNALQQVAINLGGVQNVNQIIEQNPQIQQQLQQIQTQISALAQGQVKPSDYTVQRLATDLLRTSAQAQLNPDQQLVIAIVINQMANSGSLDAAQIENAVNTALANIEGAGVPRSVSHTVGCDLHSIAFELQPNLQLQ